MQLRFPTIHMYIYALYISHTSTTVHGDNCFMKFLEMSAILLTERRDLMGVAPHRLRDYALSVYSTLHLIKAVEPVSLPARTVPGAAA
jgi:hypothetical protein